MAGPKTSRWTWIAALVMLLAFLATWVDVGFDADPRELGGAEDIARLAQRDDVNVLFILIDTLRADRLGSWGYERDTSPMLDRIAASGVRFERHLAQSSWTKCSMASLWTSLHPTRAGVTRFDHAVSEEALMPAEVLREAGFRTGAIFRNGWVAPNFGFDQGFEIYHRARSTPARLPSLRRENPSLISEGTPTTAPSRPPGSSFKTVGHGDERWFLYVHLMDVHQYTYDQESALFGTTYSDVLRSTPSVAPEPCARIPLRLPLAARGARASHPGGDRLRSRRGVR